MLDDGTNCNVHEVVTVIDLYICIGPLYISVIIFDSLSKWSHIHPRMLSTAHQVVCMYRVPSMIMTFEEYVFICIMWPLCVTLKVLQKQHLFCLVFLLLTFYLKAQPLCSAEATTGSTLLLRTHNLLVRTEFWPLSYWSTDIYFFCIEHRKCGGGRGGEKAIRELHMYGWMCTHRTMCRTTRQPQTDLHESWLVACVTTGGRQKKTKKLHCQ